MLGLLELRNGCASASRKELNTYTTPTYRSTTHLPSFSSTSRKAQGVAVAQLSARPFHRRRAPVSEHSGIILSPGMLPRPAQATGRNASRSSGKVLCCAVCA